ncbi:MAG: hypothetical protein K0S78_5938 [Thermomicrobiales bacterium]|nr:hypothetical protein [Thermomicrobiales bacterium]
METDTSVSRSAAHPLTRRIQLIGLALALLAGGAGIGAYASARAQSEATPVGSAAEAGVTDACPDALYGPDSEPWVRGELYFGTTKDDGTAYSEAEWDAFLDTEITPRFPAGLTVLTGLGQWQSAGETEITQERSQVLIILYPLESAAESSALLEEIRDAYETQFNQESVLRVDVSPVCTSF